MTPKLSLSQVSSHWAPANQGQFIYVILRNFRGVGPGELSTCPMSSRGQRTVPGRTIYLQESVLAMCNVITLPLYYSSALMIWYVVCDILGILLLLCSGILLLLCSGITPGGGMGSHMKCRKSTRWTTWGEESSFSIVSASLVTGDRSWWTGTNRRMLWV